MTKELEIAFNNVAIACAEFKGTLAEHQALNKYLTEIKSKLTEVCECKTSKEAELKEIVNKD